MEPERIVFFFFLMFMSIMIKSLIVSPFRDMPCVLYYGYSSFRDIPCVIYHGYSPFSDMPSVIYHGYGCSSWYKDYPRHPDGQMYYYMLPPIQYPDGD